jgi:rhodanese-related sulfurtransferase
MQQFILIIGIAIVVALSSSHTVKAGPTTCPLAAARIDAKAVKTPTIEEDPSCLIKAQSIHNHPTYDARTRAEFLDFHIPGAQYSTPYALAAMFRNSKTKFVVYDSGKSRSSTLLLCSRLRRAGLTQVKLIDGGIAAWAQAQRRPEKFVLNRLSDDEVLAALLDRHAHAIAMTAPLKSMLTEHRLGVAPEGVPSRRVVLAETASPLANLESQLNASKETAFYWIGTPARLRDLIHTHLLQDQKRIAGPAQSTTCSAL